MFRVEHRTIVDFRLGKESLGLFAWVARVTITHVDFGAWWSKFAIEGDGRVIKRCTDRCVELPFTTVGDRILDGGGDGRGIVMPAVPHAYAAIRFQIVLRARINRIHRAMIQFAAATCGDQILPVERIEWRVMLKIVTVTKHEWRARKHRRNHPCRWR